MLEISHRNGSYSNPCVGPRLVSTGCQTEVAEAPSPATTSPASGDLAFKIINVKSPLKSANNCTSNPTQNGVDNSASTASNVAGQVPSRPLSSASEESESSSISEDDEISFNTIKRQSIGPKKCDSTTPVVTNSNVLSNGSKNGSNLEIDNNNGLNNGDTTTTNATKIETIVES